MLSPETSESVNPDTNLYNKSLPYSSLRAPCFKFADSQISRSVLAFTSQQCQSCSLHTSSFFENDSDDDEEIEVFDDQVDKEKLTMDQCIKSLEPHLNAFRIQCNELGNHDDISAIPSPLLRVAKFFSFKWRPIQRAILRPVSYSKNEIEVGILYRLRLAKALSAKGLISFAEAQELEASFYQTKNQSNEKIKLDPMYQIEICLSNLPWETSASEAMIHFKRILLEYAKQNSNSDKICHSWNRIVDKSLIVFTALILQSGGTEMSQQSPLECHMAKILLSTSEVPDLAKAIQVRIHQLLSPHLISQLDSLHILSLARLFSHTGDIEYTVTKYLVEPLHFCSHLDLTPWSKLLAVYINILRFKENKDFMFILRENLFRVSEATNKTGTKKFIKALFANVEYYLSCVN